MSMRRKFLRDKAHRNMRKAGVRHMNRQGRSDGHRTDSFFALNWRDWINV